MHVAAGPAVMHAAGGGGLQIVAAHRAMNERADLAAVDAAASIAGGPIRC